MTHPSLLRDDPYIRLSALDAVHRLRYARLHAHLRLLPLKRPLALATGTWLGVALGCDPAHAHGVDLPSVRRVRLQVNGVNGQSNRFALVSTLVAAHVEVAVFATIALLSSHPSVPHRFISAHSARYGAALTVYCIIASISRRELLAHAEERVDPSPSLPDSPPSSAYHLRVHRSLIRPNLSSHLHREPQPDGLRTPAGQSRICPRAQDRERITYPWQS